MQFVANGPDVPEALLQAHEEERVVFFCGAGISYKAGLKSFKWLVDEIYRLCGTNRKAIEDKAYKKEFFDTTLNLLEDRLPGQRRGLMMRKALANALQPNMRRKGAADTHSALLQLAQTRQGVLRLVTTNFDRVFERVAKRDKLRLNSFSAPRLPIPKNSQWDGLVYLHGLLPDNDDDDRSLDQLVVTSGDFGLAYLTERWAARFVSELFRNYVVCFVGYSINDPVLRYMMDALAADRLRGEDTTRAYAMAECNPGLEDETIDNWKAKGVIPILYNPSNGHVLLQDSLTMWATDYRNGVRGKERVVVEHAISNPSESTKQDDFVGRMLWALSDKTGLPAKHFADFNPVPPLKWLETFAEDRYRYSDLYRFNVPADSNVDDELQFSVIRRPVPYTRAPWMTLVSADHAWSQWDDVMYHLARWLMRYLNDPALVIWVAEQGGQLHSHWISMIETELNRFEKLESEEKTTELNEIRTHSPDAIPCPQMKILWQLLLTGRVKLHISELELYRWKKRLKRDNLTTSMRLDLRKLLSPKVKLSKPFLWYDDDEDPEEPSSINQLVDWELVLTSNHVRSALQNQEDECWRNALPQLLDDFQLLLFDALGLLRELGDADDNNDRSYWDLPSISPHWQNRDFRDWIVLIELLRDAWLATRESDPLRATRIARGWFELPYPTFKRLALFAASQDDCIAPNEWVEWLVDDDSWCLWSIETQREMMRLLVSQARMLSPEARDNLEMAILAGPPRAMYRDDIDPDWWDRHVKDSVWLRLAKLAHQKEVVSTASRMKLDDIPQGRNGWRNERDNERNEFSHWMSGTGDPDYEESREIDIAPRKRRDLVKWLKQSPSEEHPNYEDTWRETCRTRFFHSLLALRDLGQEGQWPDFRWRVALQVWSEKEQVLRAWRFAGPLVQTMPNDTLQEIARSLSWWLNEVSKSIDRKENILLNLCDRILDQSYQDNEDTDEPVTQAINHPVGLATQALLNLWFKRGLNDNDTLPRDIEPFFTRLCEARIQQFRHGRVVLASRLISLFRVDRNWTETHLLPLFDWSTGPDEAKAVWEGFLWSPRLYRPLLIAFKIHFLDTAHHYPELGEHGRQFAQFLTFAALELVDGYTRQDFQSAMQALPQEGLQEAAKALFQVLDGSGEQREVYWKNRVQPFWQQIWPKSYDLASNSIAESLACLSIAAGDEFPVALDEVIDWLRWIEHPDYVVERLHESDLCDRYPIKVLEFLDAVIDDHAWVPQKLKQCLNAIAEASPDLRQDQRYRRLHELIRRRGT